MKRSILITVAIMMFTIVFSVTAISQINAAEKPILCKFQHGIVSGQKGMILTDKTLGHFIEKETNGQIKMKYWPVGSVVPASQMWDGVDSGILDATAVCTCYSMGKSFASAYFCNAPGSLPLWAKMLWYFEGGGYELAKKILYRHYPNIVIFPGGWIMTEPWLYCNKEIKSLADLKGMRIRASGVRAKVFAKIGMAAVGMTQGEIMPAMQKGVIDAFELGPFWSDEGLGFPDVADYVYIGSKYVEGSISFGVFNKKWFNRLPDDVKSGVERACHDSMHYGASKLVYMETKSLHDNKKRGSIDVRVLPEDVQDALFRASMEVIKDRIAGGDVEMKEVWESQWRFYKHWKPSFKVGKYVVNWNYMEKFVPEELKGY